MYLVPRQRDEHGLKPEQLIIDDEALRRVIAEYTREAGVRSLERQIGAIARKVAAKVAIGSGARRRTSRRRTCRITSGPPRFRSDGVIPAVAARTSRPVLAWTEVGGDVLYIEAVLLPGGSGQLTLTGQLGSVMQESARAALSHVRQQAVVVRHRARDMRPARPAHPCSRRSDSQGRPVGGRHDRDRDRLGGARHSRASGRRDDRRDHAVGARAAGGRHPREVARRAAATRSRPSSCRRPTARTSPSCRRKCGAT